MIVLRCTVMGPPVAKARPRATKGGRVYTPTKTRHYEWLVAQAAIAAGINPVDTGAVALDITVYREKPSSTPKRWEFPTTRPDLDNYVKAIMDGLSNACVWKDDAQVCDLIARKRFGSPERVEIEVYESPGNPWEPVRIVKEIP